MAVDQNLEVPVAIKALLLDNPSALKDEARVLSELRHPNVAGFRQLFEEGGKWYMVIDFVDGGTLRDLIVSRKLYDGAPEVVTNRILGIACQTGLNRDPGSASNRNPFPALGQACPGSEQEGPARSGATATSPA